MLRFLIENLFESVIAFCELLTNKKLVYLSDIFSHLNPINSSIQKPNENILTLCSKLFILKDQITIKKKNDCTKIN